MFFNTTYVIISGLLHLDVSATFKKSNNNNNISSNLNELS